MLSPHAVAVAQAAADRRRAVGLGPSPANPLSWKQAIASPAANFTFYAIQVDYESGTAAAGGGDGTAPRLWLRASGNKAWREITSRLPADATGDVQAIANHGSTWWIAGQDTAGTAGWLAKSTDDLATFTSLTTAAGITRPVRALHNLLAAALWAGGDAGALHAWSAAGGWTDLSGLGALAWTEPIRAIQTLDGTNLMIVGGASPVAAQTCAYSANAGATWSDRTAALGAVAPVYSLHATGAGEFLAAGADVFAKTGNYGANWENWLEPAASVTPIYQAVTTRMGGLVATAVGLFLEFDQGATLYLLPAKALEPVRAFAYRDSEILVCGSDVWTSEPGGTVLAHTLFQSATTPAPSRWAEITQPGGIVHYGRCRLTAIVITGGTADTITVYDATAAAGTSFTLNHPAGGVTAVAPTSPFTMSNGIYVACTQATTNVLVAYRE